MRYNTCTRSWLLHLLRMLFSWYTWIQVWFQQDSSHRPRTLKPYHIGWARGNGQCLDTFQFSSKLLLRLRRVRRAPLLVMQIHHLLPGQFRRGNAFQALGVCVGVAFCNSTCSRQQSFRRHLIVRVRRTKTIVFIFINSLEHILNAKYEHTFFPLWGGSTSILEICVGCLTPKTVGVDIQSLVGTSQSRKLLNSESFIAVSKAASTTGTSYDMQAEIRVQKPRRNKHQLSSKNIQRQWTSNQTECKTREFAKGGKNS